MQTSFRAWGGVGAVVGLVAVLTACAPSAPTQGPTAASSSSTPSKDCGRVCDPKGNGNAFMDAAYEKTYEPCLNQAVREGTTAQALGCTAKATQTCIALCEAAK